MSIHPEPDKGFGPTKILARFDVELAPALKLFGLLLKQKPDGSYRIYAPNLRGQQSAAFSPELAARVTSAAVASFIGGRPAHALPQD